MTKVRVQDAAKELSVGVGKLLTEVEDSRKQAMDLFHSIRELGDDKQREQREHAEQAERAERQRQYEQAAQFMTAYSSDQVPETPTVVETKQAQAPKADIDSKAEASKAAAPEATPPSEAAKPSAAADAASASSGDSAAVAAQSATSSASAAGGVASPAARTSNQPGGAATAAATGNNARAAQGAPAAAGARPGAVAPGTPGQYGRPAQPQGQPGQYGRPVQHQGQPGQYGRPVNPQGQPGQYGRPVQPGQGGPYGRPVNPQGQPGQYGRPVNPGQGPYGRPVQPGQGGPYGRPVNPQGQPGQYGRPAPGAGPRPGGFGGGAGGPRPGGFGGGAGGPRPGGGRPGGFGGRKSGPELTPTVEKERVSNYDPNKKQYVRQNDPERNKLNRGRGQQAGRSGFMGDDDFTRGKRKKKGMSAYKPEPIRIEKAFMTAEKITVKDLTERIGKPAGEIIKKLLLLGIMATINAELDYDTAQLVCSEFGVELEMNLAKTAEDALQDEDIKDAEGDLAPRAPVVTIMGHVDHGKTSLLDYIRSTKVASGEAGGITQHIGAYQVEVSGQKITFLDTPGHEAFTAMRARGAQVTDIAILVVAADDGVMPQTIEAINHAKAANVPTIVAINKCDKPTANPDKIKQELTEHGLVSEEWGGDTIMVPVSAHTGMNIEKLLEMILLVAEVQNYRANPDRKARGAIIEARLDKGRGPVATVLIKNGTLKIGDTIVAGTAYGRVRAMVNDVGERVKEAGPSEPVEVIGFNDVPDAGDVMSAVDDDKLSRQVAEERKDKLRVALIKAKQQTTLDDLFSQISAGQLKDLNLIVKADVQGSVEAVKQSLERLTNEEVRVNCIHGGVGAITESDIMLASASNAIIIGFNVRYDNNVRDIAEREKVDIRLYRVIYAAIEDVQAAMKGMLAPKYKEIILGRAQVRQAFRVTGVGMIAGSYVTEGKIVRNAQARLLRDNVVVQEAKVESLKRFKDDAKEVASGYECGIGLENYNDVKEGDVIECFQMEEIER